MKDSYRHKGLRRRLIEELLRKGISDQKVLEVMGKIPRHFFLEKAFEEMAYKDIPFQIGLDQTISQPYIVAYQTQTLDIRGGDKVLEVGTGSGYQAAVLSLLGAQVYTVERHEALHKKAKALLTRLGYKAHLKCGDGYQGWPEKGPFDKIIITAAPSEIPKKLLYQLKQGGKMIVPVGNIDRTQKMKLITRIEAEKFTISDLIDCKFVPMLSGINPHVHESSKTAQ